MGFLGNFSLFFVVFLVIFLVFCSFLLISYISMSFSVNSIEFHHWLRLVELSAVVVCFRWVYPPLQDSFQVGTASLPLASVLFHLRVLLYLQSYRRHILIENYTFSTHYQHHYYYYYFVNKFHWNEVCVIICDLFNVLPIALWVSPLPDTGFEAKNRSRVRCPFAIVVFVDDWKKINWLKNFKFHFPKFDHNFHKKKKFHPKDKPFF